MATLASLGAAALGPGRELARLGGRVARDTLGAPARWTLLSALDVALSALDAAVSSPVAEEALERIRASAVADDVLERLVGRAVDSPAAERLVGRAVDSPAAERLVGRAVDSPGAERLVGRVIDSRMLDAAMLQLLESDGLWVLVEKIAQSPAVTAAISQQGLGFADQMAGVVRDRSRTADDRLERLVRRLARRAPRDVAPAGNGPPSAP